ncbi:1-phosphofructokinase family hexose kinase, partial [Kocuria sp. HSID17582]|uniref:1-phosphofructokinase family hexose kinase n=1 Tax=Kocuria sp. HSID17582 TaxID=2419512 RepID=UPI001EE960F5
MIITVTLNPSVDRTVDLGAPLARGRVQRAVSTRQDPGGKGVNISRALSASGVDTVAVAPGDDTDPLFAALDAVGVRYDSVSIGAPIRSNITVTEPDGTTTKINEPGPVLDERTVERIVERIVSRGAGASWLVFAGSVPPGPAPRWHLLFYFFAGPPPFFLPNAAALPLGGPPPPPPPPAPPPPPPPAPPPLPSRVRLRLIFLPSAASPLLVLGPRATSVGPAPPHT